MSKGHFILYDSNEKNFTSMGVLVLDNYISNTCIKETMNENYTFEFEMFNSVAHMVEPRMYIKAPTRKGDELFRVRIIEKDMNNYGATYFYCTQVFFCDMEDNFIENLELTNVTGYAALDSMDTSTQYPHKFNFYSDISVKNSTVITRKNFVTALIGDSEYSFVNTWGGELEVNKFDVKMMSKIGQDRGVRVRYRKNLTGLNAKTDYSSYCTRIMPLGYDDITIPEKYVDSDNLDPSHPIVRVVEFSNIKVKTNEEDEEGFDTLEEAQNALRESARRLFTDGKLDMPESTYEVDFQDLYLTVEYHDDYAILENIFLGDTVEVYHEELDIFVTTRCVSYEYDPKTDRYNTITLGNAISKFSSSSVKNQATIIDKINNTGKDYQTKLDDAVEKLTGMINSGLKGHVVITENEIMIMDTTDKDTAVEVWRYNINGLGYSNTGYNGPFIGLTKDGKLLVTEATTNKFTAALINAGILQSVDKSSWFDLDSGTFSWANGAIVYDGHDLTIKVGNQKIDDLLDATFNIVVSKEHQVITLDTNDFPVNNGRYEFTFTVLKGNTTTTTPCIVNSVTPSKVIPGVTFEMMNNTCTMVIDKTKRLLGITEESFDVEIEVKDYRLHKIITWSTIHQGRDGVDGVNGTNGISSYFHVKYAPNNNPTASEITDTPQEYIGTYVDNIQADSNDPSKYTWIKIQGTDGTSITIDYTVSTLPSTGEIGKYYYVNTTGILWRYEETGWVELGKIQGPQGIPGTNGVDGRTQYLHIKYSNDGGKTFTTNNGEDVGMYIGTYVDFNEPDSEYVSAYKWARIKGIDGNSASYVKIVESARIFAKPQGATDYTPSTITLTPELTNCTFNKWQYSTNGGSSWTNVTSGTNGLTVTNGVLTISKSSPLFTDSITSVSFKVTASDGSSDVTTIVRLKDGIDGTTAAFNQASGTKEPKSVVGANKENQTTGLYSVDCKTISGKQITVSFDWEVTGDTKYGPFKIQISGDNYWAPLSDTITVSDTKYSGHYSSTRTLTDNASVCVRAEVRQDYFQGTLTISKFKIELNSEESEWLPTVAELEGESATNVTLGNENHTFQATSDGNAIANSITFEVDGFVGTTEKEVIIGTITGVPTGMTVTPSGSGSTNTYITVEVTTAMTSINGIVTIPVTCNGMTFNKQFTYSLAVPGKDGTNGTNGIDGTSSYFHIKYSPVENPTSAQMTETVNTYIGTYVDTSPTDSTDPSKYTWSRFIGKDGNNGANGLPGKDGKDGTTYYLHVKYSDDGKTFTSNNGETPGAWLGQYADTVEADSTLFSKYKWSKIRGDDGINASYVRILASNQVFLLEDKATAYTPSSIKLTPVFTNSSYNGWQYSNNNGSSWIDVTSGSNGLTISSGVLTIANTCNLYTNSITSIQFKVLGSNNTSDVMTITRIKNGIEGATPNYNLVSNSYKIGGHQGVAGSFTGSWSYVADSDAVCGYHIEVKCTTAGSGGPHFPVFTTTTDRIGKVYTWSFWAKASVSKALYDCGHESGGLTPINLTTSWQKFTKTWTFNDNAYSSFVFYVNGWNLGDILYIKDFKIEEGDRATAWLPTVEEMKSVTIQLSNENHTFQATSNGKAVDSSILVNLYGLIGSTQSSVEIGDITGIPTGMTITKNNSGSTSASLTISVNDSLTTKNGIISIPLTCNGTTITKIFTYALSIPGANGANGADASYVVATPSTLFFKRTANEIDFSPSTIKISAEFTNCSYLGWQYSTTGGDTWANVTSESSGLTISGTTLTVANNSGLFWNTTSVVFKVKASSNKSDVVTISRLDDGSSTNFNILTETNRGDRNWYWTMLTGDYTTASEVHDGINCCKFIRGDVEHSGWNVIGYNNVPKNKLKTNTTYTLSLEVKSSATSNDIYVSLRNGDYSNSITDTFSMGNISQANVWTKLKATFTTYSTIPDGAYPVVYLTKFNATVGVTHIIRNIKLEEGVHATPWAPAIEELEGESAVNIILGNENHTFVASSEGVAVESSTNTTVVGYKGTTLTACSIGTISGLPTGMTASISNNGTTSASIKFTVTTSLNTKNGVVTIPVTCGGITVNKQFTYSLAVAGVNGTNGTNAKLIKINASTNVFKSTDGGTTFSPSSITLTSTMQNVSYSSWQYSTNGGSSWTNVTSGSNGLTISGSNLVIAVTCSLYNTTVTAVTFKVNSNTSGVYDTLTVYKLYDRTDINDKFNQMSLTINQSNTKWEAAFKNTNANNMLMNSDAMTGDTSNWVNNGGGLSVALTNAFPFYGPKDNYFKTAFPKGARYAHDLPLEPNTDYVYEGYIYTNKDIRVDSNTPLHFWIWTGTNPTATRLCTIVDYRQTLSSGRFNKCYCHFKTNDVSESLYGRFFVYSSHTADHVAFKKMSLKKGTVETEWTQHPNEIRSTSTSIDQNGITIKHSDVGTYTQMSANGFSIRDSSNGEVLAWLSSKSQWTEMRVDKVFAKNIQTVYEGPSNLYVNHAAAAGGDGSSSNPFNSFAQLRAYLLATPVIDKDLVITVRDPGFIINEQLCLERLTGGGSIQIYLEDKLVICNPGGGQECIRLIQMPAKSVWIRGNRAFGSKDTGPVLQDGGSGNSSGIYAATVGRLEVNNMTIACAKYGIQTERVYLYTYQLDYGKCATAVDLCRQSIYYSMQDVGSCSTFCNLHSGSIAYWGNCGGVRPIGGVILSNGVYYDSGSNLTQTASPRFPTSNPTPPASSGQIYTYTYNWTSHKTYQYQWSNWEDSDCKQGAWGYGLRGGHMFFNLSAIRSNMTGTIQDGNTITLTRANSGGNSGQSNVYINGSNCSSASGTPSYGGQTHLGTLAWGETKTFTLPKAIVQGLVNGTYNSLAVYVNSTASNNYINIVNCSITLKTKK